MRLLVITLVLAWIAVWYWGWELRHYWRLRRWILWLLPVIIVVLVFIEAAREGIQWSIF